MIMELSDFRKKPCVRGYEILRVEGSSCPWRVVFSVDGVEGGSGQYQTHDQAEEAGIEWMFSGWGDE